MDDMMRRTLAETIAQDDADLAASRAISQRQERMMDEGEALYEDEESEDEEPSPRALPVVRS